MDELILKKIKIAYTLSACFIGILLCAGVNAFPAQYDRGEKQSNIAPERNYERETVTFPRQIKDASNVNKADNNIEKPKTSALTNSVVPMIVMGAIVLGIFLWICLTIVKKLLPGGKKLFSSPGLEILGRTHFDSQKYMALVRAGTRILVVGVSPNGFDQLCEITDPEEITEVLSAAKPKTSTGQNLFYKIFQKQILGNENIEETNKKAIPPTNLKTDSEKVLDRRMNEETESEITERQERIKKIRDLES